VLYVDAHGSRYQGMDGAIQDASSLGQVVGELRGRLLNASDWQNRA
jgi:hypothetical protein